MNATVSDFAGLKPRFAPNPSRLGHFLATRTFDRPTLVMDREAVAGKFRDLAAGLGTAMIHYAMKANPTREVLETLCDEGCGFDAASRGEIELCLSLGISADRISFGNTIKRSSDISFAHASGIALFAADSDEELEKIALNAPGARVYIRMLVGATEADWPLSRKFGCAPDRVHSLLFLARSLGLDPVGLSFHVGSQTRAPAMWADTLDRVAKVWHAAQAEGHGLRLINIGGGFPATIGEGIPHLTDYAGQIIQMVRARFGSDVEIMAEPGRAMVADAGVIAAEVMLVSRKSDNDLCRWVYLDIGRFSGLAETENEAIRYELTTERDHEGMGPCILAGPSCDSVDVLYEKRPVMMPLGLKSGDRVLIHVTGAYTSAYSSVGFNGFPPLDVVVI